MTRTDLLDETAHDALDHTGLTGVSASGAGRAHVATFPGVQPSDDFSAAGDNLAAVSGGNGGALAVFIHVPAPMLLQSYGFWNNNTGGTARSAEFRLYKDNGDATIDFVTGSDATWSESPAANGLRSSGAVSGAPVSLGAGIYVAVIRNTHASNTVNVGRFAPATGILFGANRAVNAAVPALGATIDVTGWTWSGVVSGIRLNGRVFGQTTAWA